MHHWAVGGDIYIGWPDHGAAERRYTIVEMDLFGKVFRGRVTNGQRQGGFMVILDCPNVILEQLAEQASNVVGFRVIVSNLRTSIDGVVVAASITNGTQPPSSPSAPTPWRWRWPACMKRLRRAGPVGEGTGV